MSNRYRFCAPATFAKEIEELKVLLSSDLLPIAWSERDLDRLGIRSVYSLRRDRREGGGIPYVKDKGHITYPVVEVLRWMKANLKSKLPEGDPVPAGESKPKRSTKRSKGNHV